MYTETAALSNWLADNPETSLGEFYYHSCGYRDCTLYLKKSVTIRSLAAC